MGRFADILGTLANGFRIGPKGAQGLADMSGLTADRTFTFPDASGTVQVSGHYDGGNASSVYTTGQHTFDGGSASG